MNIKLVLVAVLILIDLLIPEGILLFAMIKKDEIELITPKGRFATYKSKRALKSDEMFMKAQKISAEYHTEFGLLAMGFTLSGILLTVIFLNSVYVPSAIMIAFDIICIVLCKILTENKLKKEEP